MTRNVSVDTGPSRYTQNTSLAAIALTLRASSSHDEKLLVAAISTSQNRDPSLAAKAFFDLQCPHTLEQLDLARPFQATKSVRALTCRYRAKSSDLRFSGTTREIHQAVP